MLEKLGYVAHASFPLYFYQKPFVPYHPSVKDWTRPGKMRIVEIPIVFEDRRVGSSKMSRRIVLEAIRKVWSIRFSGFGRGG